MEDGAQSFIQYHGTDRVDAAFDEVEGDDAEDRQCQGVLHQRIGFCTHLDEIIHFLTHQCHVEGDDDIQVCDYTFQRRSGRGFF